MCDVMRSRIYPEQPAVLCPRDTNLYTRNYPNADQVINCPSHPSPLILTPIQPEWWMSWCWTRRVRVTHAPLEIVSRRHKDQKSSLAPSTRPTPAAFIQSYAQSTKAITCSTKSKMQHKKRACHSGIAYVECDLFGPRSARPNRNPSLLFKCCRFPRKPQKRQKKKNKHQGVCPKNLLYDTLVVR
jgi:hypothetical protein